jgi:predicted metal-dependent phosphoesterase TrpH
MKVCDLHMHSTHSDGTCTPRELVAMARRKGLAAIALTDHATLSGVAEAQEAGRALGVRVLSGVEISVEYASKTVHMLGYCFDSGSQVLRAGLERILGGRHERNLKIVEKLNELGCAVTYEDVAAEAGGKVVGRPHFARALIRRGYAATNEEAFEKFLARGAAAYVERLRFSPANAVAMIRSAGGIPVLAHPKFVPVRDGESLEDIVRTLREAGLMGIECHYSLHTPEETRRYLDLARRYSLIVTGGTDFHGDVKPEIEMGTGLGELRVPLECADALENAPRD